jgi:hypothetical protein
VKGSEKNDPNLSEGILGKSVTPFILYRNDTVIGEGYFKRLTLKFFLSDKSVISDYRF